MFFCSFFLFFKVFFSLLVGVLLCMIRSQPESNIFEFDPEIEWTLRVLRRAQRTLSEPDLCDNTFSTIT